MPAPGGPFNPMQGGNMPGMPGMPPQPPPPMPHGGEPFRMAAEVFLLQEYWA